MNFVTNHSPPPHDFEHADIDSKLHEYRDWQLDPFPPQTPHASVFLLLPTRKSHPTFWNRNYCTLINGMSHEPSYYVSILDLYEGTAGQYFSGIRPRIFCVSFGGSWIYSLFHFTLNYFHWNLSPWHYKERLLLCFYSVVNLKLQPIRNRYLNDNVHAKSPFYSKSKR